MNDSITQQAGPGAGALNHEDIAAINSMANEYESLAMRWKDARAYSQEVANLHATYKAREHTLGKLAEGGLFRRLRAALAVEDSRERCASSDAKNAARYRWLRDRSENFGYEDDSASPWVVIGTSGIDQHPCSYAALDAAVDAAMHDDGVRLGKVVAQVVSESYRAAMAAASSGVPQIAGRDGASDEIQEESVSSPREHIEQGSQGERSALPAAAPSAEGSARFPATYCSQCGGEFGPGNEGYSRCEDHASTSPDRLDMDYINRLPQPFLLRRLGGKTWWPVYDIEVQTGLVRMDVCGLLEVVPIGDIAAFRDDSGKEHDPEDFYVGAPRQVEHSSQAHEATTVSPPGSGAQANEQGEQA